MNKRAIAGALLLGLSVLLLASCGSVSTLETKAVTQTTASEATAAEETTATESAEQPETAAAEAESTTEEDQHMKKKELKAALEKAEAALADHKDQHLRLMAEYQNYRNRTTEEKKKIYGDAKASSPC